MTNTKDEALKLALHVMQIYKAQLEIDGIKQDSLGTAIEACKLALAEELLGGVVRRKALLDRARFLSWCSKQLK